MQRDNRPSRTLLHAATCVCQSFLVSPLYSLQQQTLSLSASSKRRCQPATCGRSVNSYAAALLRAPRFRAPVETVPLGATTKRFTAKFSRCKFRRAKHALCEIRQQLFYTTKDKQVALSTTSDCRVTAPRV